MILACTGTCSTANRFNNIVKRTYSAKIYEYIIKVPNSKQCLKDTKVDSVIFLSTVMNSIT